MTLLFSHPDCDRHVTPPGHPERVERLAAIRGALAGLALDRREAPLADPTEILRCHPRSYLESIAAAVPAQGFRALDPDTWLSPGSLDAALRAAGGCVAAVDAVMAGEAPAAFVACRPPGHHALADASMGFCLFGNVAIAAKRALDVHGLARVAVVDFDVHHGNGTQALLWDEPRALFCSSHQMPLWPGSGRPDERGGSGNVLNVPLAPGSDGAAMRRAWERLVLPAVDAFRPELILVSAGFDAHADDPLANLLWLEDDYAWLTARICELAAAHAGGRVVSTLEGGYDLAALAASAAAHVRGLGELER
jgi:acetoin utilization deacetylase AcuC-like enzyme